MTLASGGFNDVTLKHLEELAADVRIDVQALMRMRSMPMPTDREDMWGDETWDAHHSKLGMQLQHGKLPST